VYCDKCGGSNTTWSEYEKLIWCFDCKIDTRGTEGIFGGPVSVGVANMMGISFDRIRLEDGKLLKMEIKDGNVIWNETKVDSNE